MPWLSPEEIKRIPSERLGVLILHRLDEVSPHQAHLNNFVNECLAEWERTSATPSVAAVYYSQDLRQGNDDLVEKISDAWAWLEHQRYLGPDPHQRPGSEWRAITSRGKEVLRTPVEDALARIRAGHLLGEDLHPRIEKQARGPWNEGDFATAIFNSAREIEIAVGEQLPPQKRKLYGVDVANAAFGKDKPLTDPNQDPGEQEGTRALFAGYIGTFKNPGSHRHFEPDDPVQAAEIIRTADLLIRMLDDRVLELKAAAAEVGVTA
jgi:uncharacterized protein (TIGR02391 family)